VKELKMKFFTLSFHAECDVNDDERGREEGGGKGKGKE
jgi:hypothetical protein